MSYQIKQAMKEEIRTAIKESQETLEKVHDNLHEWVDNYLPIYYNEIVEEWQKMPASYDDRGRAELGAREDFTIHHLMSLDLFLYYTDLFIEAVAELEEEAAN